jgi:ubiquinol-cytochrome c reductase cytochrome c1 subunit
MKLSISRSLIAGVAALGLTVAAAAPAFAARTSEHPEPVGYSFDGAFGKFDQAQLQRGFKVWKEVCSSCHSMNLLAIGDLAMKGGPFYKEHVKPNDNPYVKAIAAEYEVNDIDTETGDTIKRKATPADHFPAPYPNATAAAASNSGAVPPDHSVIVKARHGGADYVYHLLTGYKPAPAGLKVGAGQYYNPYMPGDLATQWNGKGPVPKGGLIAMAPPLQAGQVTFDDGTPSTLSQEAKDVAAFLAWASDPHATDRKQTGFAVMIFLLLFAGITYGSYRRIWKDVAH